MSQLHAIVAAVVSTNHNRGNGVAPKPRDISPERVRALARGKIVPPAMPRGFGTGKNSGLVEDTAFFELMDAATENLPLRKGEKLGPLEVLPKN